MASARAHAEALLPSRGDPGYSGSMNLRSVMFAGFGVGLLLSSAQACVLPFDCINLVSERPKLCANLFEVVDSGGGTVTEALGEPPRGCACLSVELAAVFDDDAQDPELDDLYAEIEVDARARCQQLAIDAGQDPSACESATLNKGDANKTPETFEECTQLVGQIDEDRDGNCPEPEGVWIPEGSNGDSDTEGGETGGGSVGLLDLPRAPAP